MFIDFMLYFLSIRVGKEPENHRIAKRKGNFEKGMKNLNVA